MHVLALNSGSSSLKFGLYAVDAATAVALVDGAVDSLGTPAGRIRAAYRDGRRLDETLPDADGTAAMASIGRFLDGAGLPRPDAIGHRVVHGGPTLRDHRRIDDDVLARLDAAVAFAPLHVPPAIAWIRDARTRYPAVPQVACLDTAFHASLDARARTLPLPQALRADGIERYGFHGLSCESIVAQLGTSAPPRIVIAHLGSGASVTAVRDGRSVDTSMGLTPSGGVVMATRSGDLDPGVLLYLLREKGYDAASLEDLLDRRAGLLGLSGTAGDVRTLRASEPSDADARLALTVFAYSVAKAIAAMIVALDGIDLLVFTGGIGEHDAPTRAAICADLRWIGVSIDRARNVAGRAAGDDGDDGIAAADARCAIRIVPTQEDAQIARHAYTLTAAAARDAG